jgi:hypothetical protein
MSSNDKVTNIFTSKEAAGPNSYGNIYSDKAKRIFTRLNSSTTGVIKVTKKVDETIYNDVYNGELGKIYVKLNSDANLSTTTGVIKVTKKVDETIYNDVYNGELGKIYVKLNSKTKGEIYISKEAEGLNNYTKLNVPEGEFVRIFGRIEKSSIIHPSIQPVTFAAIGDIDEKNEENKDKIWKNIIESKASFLLALGDLTYDKGKIQENFIDKCSTFLKDLHPDKIYPIIGNHDDKENGDPQDSELLLKTFNKPPNGYYHFDEQNIRFIMMNI